MGSPVFHKGWVYLYGCTRESTCFSIRATAANVTLPSAWQWFDGTNYVGTKAQRRPLAGVGCFGGVVRPESTSTSLVVTYAAHGTFRTRVSAIAVTVPPR